MKTTTAALRVLKFAIPHTHTHTRTDGQTDRHTPLSLTACHASLVSRFPTAAAAAASVVAAGN